MSQSVRIFILSGNRLFRESLTRIFSKKSDIEVVCSQQFGPKVIEDLFSSSPDILLLDSLVFLRSVAPSLAKDPPEGKHIKTLMVAMDEDEELFLEVVRHGAYGYIPKEASAMDLIAAVRSIAQGEAVCTPRLCKFLFDLVARQAADTPRRRMTLRGLTRREQELIPLIDRGLTNKEIAAHLHLSEQTVKNHIHHILYKVGAENRLSVSEACRVRDVGLSEYVLLA